MLQFYLKNVRFVSEVFVCNHSSDPGLEVYGITPSGKMLPLDQNSSFELGRQYYGLWTGFAVSTDTMLRGSSDSLVFYFREKIKTVQLSEIADNWKCSPGTEHRLLFLSPAGFSPEASRKEIYRAAFSRIRLLQLYLLLPLVVALFIFFRKRFLKTISKCPDLASRSLSMAAGFLLKMLHKSWKPALWSSFATIIISLSVIYGYMFFRFGMSGFISFVLALFWFSLLLSLPVFLFRKRILPCTGKRIRRFVIIFAVLLCALEGYFRISGEYYTFNEKQGDFYKSGFNASYLQKGKPWLRYEPGSKSGSYNRKEFNYNYEINSEGLRDREHDSLKSPGVCRILCMGNSFTEGIGTPQDSTWPALLEKILNGSGDTLRYEVMNAGVASNDLFFQLPLYENLLRKYHPDHVILAVGPIEFTFFRYRGGMERFAGNEIHFRKAPAWEGLYALSHTFRFLVRKIKGYDHTFQNAQDKAKHRQDALPLLIAAADSLSMLVKTDGAGFSLLVFPEIATYCCNDKDYFLLLSGLEKCSNHNTFDLYRYFSSREKINNHNYRDFFWVQDGHPKPSGYAAFARGVYHFLKSEAALGKFSCPAVESAVSEGLPENKLR